MNEFEPISLEDWVAREVEKLPDLSVESDQELRRILGLA